MQTKQVKILVADDHVVVRQGLRQMLRDEFGPTLVLGEAVDGSQAVEMVAKQRWDLVLLDISMPGRTGLETLQEIKSLRNDLPVLMLSMFAEEEYAVRAIKAGAAGYVSKQSLGDELLSAVRKVLGGQRHITAKLAQLLAEDIARPSDRLPHETLSEREVQVMKMLAEGKSVKEIAGDLNLSDKTVFTYRTRLLEKLGLRSDVEVARYAWDNGLLKK